VTEKRCSKCGETKPTDAFHKHKGHGDGLASECKLCSSIAGKAWYAANLDKARAGNKASRGAHLEARTEYYKRWCAANPDKVKANCAAWRLDNLDRKKEMDRAYGAAHREQIKEKKKRWYLANYDMVVASLHVRRALKVATGGKVTAKEWAALVESYGGRCLRCGATDKKLTLDHVVPLSKGGRNTIDNAQPLCKSCNCSKKANIIDYRIGRENVSYA
jgi:5-methylcytosine-specific restriction endonuclease McrA